MLFLLHFRIAAGWIWKIKKGIEYISKKRINALIQNIKYILTNYISGFNLG